MSSLRFKQSAHHSWSVLSDEGQVDSKTVGQFQEALDQISQSSIYLAIDLAKVSFMSSAGLRLLLVMHNKASSQGTSLSFVGINEDIQDVMRVTGFLQHFTLISSIEDLPIGVQ